MKKALSLSVLWAALAIGSPITTPNFSTDAIPYAGGGIGQSIHLIPDTVFYASWEDLPSHMADWDYNDFLLAGVIHSPVGGNVQIDIGFMGGLSDWIWGHYVHNNPATVAVSVWSPYASFVVPYVGTPDELVFTLRNPFQGIEINTGTPSVWAYQSEPLTGTPEPASMALTGSALCAAMWWLRRRTA